MTTQQINEIRQGDVLLIRVERLPEGAVKRQDRTLALGEATGHHHTLTAEATVFGEIGGLQWVVVEDAPATLNHMSGGQVIVDDHAPITQIPVGVWLVPVQEAYVYGQNTRIED